MTESHRIPGLDGVRGIAILYVMCLHFLHDPAAEYLGGPFVEVVTFGWSGVDLFFVLSGFLITGTLLSTRGHSRYFLNFYARRTLRIFPVYYLAVTMLFVIARHSTGGPPERMRYVLEHKSWIYLYGTNFLIAKNGEFILGLFNHFWTLAVEEHFYLLWPAAVWLLDARRLRLLSICLIVGPLILRIVLVRALPHNPASFVITPCRIDALVFGGLLSSYCRGPGTRSVGRWAKALGLVGSLLVLTVGLARHRLDLGDPWMTTLGLTGVFAVCGALVVHSISPSVGLYGKVVNNAVLGFFGRYSYGLYVFHQPIHVVLRRFVPFESVMRHTGSVTVSLVFYFGLFGTISVAVALLSWHLFEKHFLQLKRLF